VGGTYVYCFLHILHLLSVAWSVEIDVGQLATYLALRYLSSLPLLGMDDHGAVSMGLGLTLIGGVLSALAAVNARHVIQAASCT
jgi:hypothetical protein